MKRIFSSSSDSTITSNSIDVNSRTRRAATGWFMGVFSWFFCFSSSLVGSEGNLRSMKGVDKVEHSVTPGIVARLMGLETMPEAVLAATTRASPNSITRSRSMNSVDSLRDVVSIQVRHRRVKSFREAPTFIDLEDENFFVLSFKNGRRKPDSKDSRLKTRTMEMESGVLKKKNADKCKKKSSRRLTEHEDNKENQGVIKALNATTKGAIGVKPAKRVVYDCKLKDSTNVLQLDAIVNKKSHIVKVETPKNSGPKSGGRTSKKKENLLPVGKLEPECDTENASPVSVLDFEESVSDTKVAVSEVSRFTNTYSRRNLLEELETYKNALPLKETLLIIKDSEAKNVKGKCSRSRRKGNYTSEYIEMLGTTRKLAAKELMARTWIKHKQRLEDFEEISTDFGLQIQEQLLTELVNEIVGDLDQQC